jgi:GNAT superfamily N-acetyltransferase
MIEIHRMVQADTGFVFECLKELRGSAEYSIDRFEAYVKAYCLLDHPDFQIMIGASAFQPVGILTCNRFAMPRYLGFGYEIEEIVISPALQGKGYGKAMIEAFLAWSQPDQSIRKIILKTDDGARAGRLYSQFFDIVHTTVYAKAMCRI